MNQAALFALAAATAQKFGNLQCREFARAFQAALMKGREQGRLMRLRTCHNEDFIVIRDPADARTPATAHNSITRNGKHFGVQVGEFVFDNVLREGKKRDEWVAAFECAGGEFSVQEVEWSEL